MGLLNLGDNSTSKDSNSSPIFNDENNNENESKNDLPSIDYNSQGEKEVKSQLRKYSDQNQNSTNNTSNQVPQKINKRFMDNVDYKNFNHTELVQNENNQNNDVTKNKKKSKKLIFITEKNTKKNPKQKKFNAILAVKTKINKIYVRIINSRLSKISQFQK